MSANRCFRFLGAVGACLVMVGGAESAPSAPALSRLRVSGTRRDLVREDGTAFFYLGDTAWELFHRLTREDAEKYLADRASKGFTVIQAVALAEHGGIDKANAYGHLPLTDKDPEKPAVKDGPDDDYWDHVDWIIDRIGEKGMYVGLLPTWGSYVTSDCFNGIVDGVFTASKARVYGEFIGRRYRDRPHIIWILGGDRAAPTDEAKAVWRAMAQGIAIGVAGSEDYDQVLMTYHTSGPGHSSDFFHGDAWCDFDAIQSSHGDMVENWQMIEKDYALSPPKPTIDLETTYPDVHILKDQNDADDDDARRSAYWAVFAGACGHTYGHHSIWQMYAPGAEPLMGVKKYWYDALEAPSARQMGYLRMLIESRPMLKRIPDQTLVRSDPGMLGEHVQATRAADSSYAFIYIPTGKIVNVHLERLSGGAIRAVWFDPRTGVPSSIGVFGAEGSRSFAPPSIGEGNDWVLVLDDVNKQYPVPGMIQ